jgi:hypothetical protein
MKVDAIAEAGEQFSHPYVDIDEERLEPLPHRYVHGGFRNTETRFSLYFPPAGEYEGRFMHAPGANMDGPGFEDIWVTMGLSGGLGFAFERKAYLVCSVPFPGYNCEPGDPTYAYRATAAAALQSRQIAAQVYGEEPHHGYIWGGSGGGARTLDCMQNTSGVWDGAVPFMTAGREVNGHITIFASYYSAQTNVRRLLGSKIEQVIDALEPGGSGNPFEGLTSDQTRELASLFRLGYPRGSEFLLRDPTADIALWTWVVRDVIASEPSYFERFWSEPGYAGFDRRDLLESHLIDEKATVKRVLTVNDLIDPTVLASLDADDGETDSRSASAFVGGMPLMLSMLGDDQRPVAVQLDRKLKIDVGGARVRMAGGAAAGRTLYALGGGGSVVLVSTTGSDEAQAAFAGVVAGDEISVDNREFLAYGYYYRHHVTSDEFLVDGVPMHPQDPAATWPSNWGELPTGPLNGKVILVHHAQDPYVWPPDMISYVASVHEALGERRPDNFRFWFLDRAEHIFPPMKDEGPVPVHSTRLINYTPGIEQAMHDVIDWVENGVAPADDTGYEFTRDKAVVLAPTAAERGGIQPVVSARANGSLRAEVGVGEPVTLEVAAETPPGAGTIISIEWDLEGRGDWPVVIDGIDGTKTKVSSQTTYAFSAPGTYFPSVRVTSHRQGDVNADRRRLPNIARVRVVVT